MGNKVYVCFRIAVFLRNTIHANLGKCVRLTFLCKLFPDTDIHTLDEAMKCHGVVVFIVYSSEVVLGPVGLSCIFGFAPTMNSYDNCRIMK